MKKPSGWVVYMLRCRDGSLYTGMTNDLARRVEKHALGRGAAYTRSRLPVVLVYSRRAKSLGSALRKEAQLKQLSRAEKLALISQRPRSGPAPLAAARRSTG